MASKLLEELAEQATEYCINLNELVDRDPMASFRGGNALVYQGILRPRGTCVAVKTILGALPDNLKTIKVDLLFLSLVGFKPTYLSFRGYSGRRMSGPNLDMKTSFRSWE